VKPAKGQPSRWVAWIRTVSGNGNPVTRQLGFFHLDDEEGAARAYDSAVRAQHGHEAMQNFPCGQCSE
jgi:hypothetical protein